MADGDAHGLLTLVHALDDASATLTEAFPSHDTARWLAMLARHPAFRDASDGRPASTGVMAAQLARLLRAAGQGAVPPLLLATLRALPLDPGHLAVTTTPPAPFGSALAILLRAEPPDPEAVRVVLHNLHAFAAGDDSRGSAAPGLRLQVVATQLALAIRLAAPPAPLARLLHDLGTLAERGAAALRPRLAGAEAQVARMRDLMNDPAFAMRTHSLVPRRSMAAGEGEGVRKEFARDDRLAARARDQLRRATDTAAALRHGIDSLATLSQRLQGEAGAVLAGGR